MKKYFFIIIPSFFFLYFAVISVLAINAKIPVGSCLFFPDGRAHDTVIKDSLALARKEKFEKASALIKPLACNGVLDAQYLLSEYYNDPDALDQPEVGEKILYQLAEKNYEPALYDVGWLLVAKSHDAPIEEMVNIIYEYEVAWLFGSEAAEINIMVLYDLKPDILVDMEKAARNGNAMAQFNMGWIYAIGLMTEEGLMRDLDVADDWFLESASQGFQDSIEVLEKRYTVI